MHSKKTVSLLLLSFFITHFSEALPMLEEKAATLRTEEARSEQVSRNTEKRVSLSRYERGNSIREIASPNLREASEEELSQQVTEVQNTSAAWEAESQTLSTLPSEDLIPLHEAATAAIAILQFKKEALRQLPENHLHPILNQEIERACAIITRVQREAQDRTTGEMMLSTTAALSIPTTTHPETVAPITTPPIIAADALNIQEQQNLAPRAALNQRRGILDFLHFGRLDRMRYAEIAVMCVALYGSHNTLNKTYSFLKTKIPFTDPLAASTHAVSSLVASSHQALCHQLESGYVFLPELSMQVSALLKCKSYLDDVTETSPGYLSFEENQARWATGILLKKPLLAEKSVQQAHKKALHSTPSEALSNWNQVVQLRKQANQAWSQVSPNVLKNRQAPSVSSWDRSLEETERLRLHSMAQGILEKRNQEEVVATSFFPKVTLQGKQLSGLYQDIPTEAEKTFTALRSLKASWKKAEQELENLDWIYDTNGKSFFKEQTLLGQERCKALLLVGKAEETLALEVQEIVLKDTPLGQEREESLFEPTNLIPLGTPATATTLAWKKSLDKIKSHRDAATTKAFKELWNNYLIIAQKGSIKAQTEIILLELYREETALNIYLTEESFTYIHTRLLDSWKRAFKELQYHKDSASPDFQPFWKEALQEAEARYDHLLFLPLYRNLKHAEARFAMEVRDGQTTDSEAAKETLTRLYVEELDAYRAIIQHLTQLKQDHPDRFTSEWKAQLEEATDKEKKILAPRERTYSTRLEQGGRVIWSPQRKLNNIQEYLKKRDQIRSFSEKPKKPSNTTTSSAW